MVDRVISLLPSATEIVCALGCGERLVGRSHECDFPAWVERLPVCTAPRFAPSGSSVEIDRQVRDIVSRALAVYELDTETLLRLRPQLIVTQSQCEVCAVSERDVEQALGDRLGGETRIVSLCPETLSDIWEDIQRVADALEVTERGFELTQVLWSRVDSVAAAVASIASRPSVACIEWIEPLMTAGNWIPEMIELAGGRNLFGETGTRSKKIDFEQLCSAAPDIILVAPCGFSIERSLQDLPVLARLPGWEKIPAVKNGRVFVADGNQYFNRPGPRIVDSLEMMAEMFHPDRFDYGHATRSYRTVNP